MTDIIPLRGVKPEVSPEALEHYIILPGRHHNDYGYPDLLVAKIKSLYKMSWYEAHKALEREGSRMLTIRQFLDFLQLLQSAKIYDGLGRQLPQLEVHNIYKKIVGKFDAGHEARELIELFEIGYLKDESGKTMSQNKFLKLLENLVGMGSEFSSEYLDAYFNLVRRKDTEVKIHFDNKVTSGSPLLVEGTVEPLEEFINKSRYFDISNCNKQGLPTKAKRFFKKRGLYFVPPPSAEMIRFGGMASVALVRASKHNISLICNNGRSTMHRVRAVKSRD